MSQPQIGRFWERLREPPVREGHWASSGPAWNAGGGRSSHSGGAVPGLRRIGTVARCRRNGAVCSWRERRAPCRSANGRPSATPRPQVAARPTETRPQSRPDKPWTEGPHSGPRADTSSAHGGVPGWRVGVRLPRPASTARRSSTPSDRGQHKATSQSRPTTSRSRWMVGPSTRRSAIWRRGCQGRRALLRAGTLRRQRTSRRRSGWG